MYIKIYFDEKPVFLCNEINKEINEILHHPDVVFVDEISVPAIRSMLHEIRKAEFHTGVLWNPDLEKLKSVFFKNFTAVHAAGGIVQNSDKEFLFIFRLGKWDLPKGKMDGNETAEDCALREITEETGIKDLKLKKKAGETYHTYTEFGKHFLKITTWFYITCPAEQVPVPQTIENITEAKWIKTKNIKEPMRNTYASIKDILGKFFDEP